MDEENDLSVIIDSIARQAGFENTEALMTRLSREQALGDKGTIFGDLFYGINRRMQGNAGVPSNTDLQGMTFFTRPNMNLSYDNVAGVRELTGLLTTYGNTYQRAIRTILDHDSASKRNVNSPGIVDDKSAFIPLLSNSIISCSGWPDLALNTYVSSEGVGKESWMMNDGQVKINGRYDLSISFQNMLGDPITLLFFVWLHYIGAVYTNTMMPWPYSITENEVDYQTRIYRFVLDYSGRFIQKWAACGAAQPGALSMGAAFNFSRDNPYSEENSQITVPFVCIGAMYNDYIVLEEFNKVGEMFNPAMEDGARQEYYRKLAPSERSLFNYSGYPRVNLKTQELEWWVDNNVYEAYLKGKL